MATILYGRVSTTEQTIAHQRTQAEAAGFHLDDVVFDEGVSGVSVKLRDRPNGKRLFDMLRAGDTLVVRWVNRLGRNYDDITTTLREFLGRGVIVRTVIGGMVFDGSTKDPMQRAVRDALICFMAAMSEAEAEVTKEAQRAGIAHAKAQMDRTAYKGRKPEFDRKALTLVQGMLAQGQGVTEVARASGLSRQAIYRIKADPAAAEKSLAVWGL